MAPSEETLKDLAATYNKGVTLADLAHSLGVSIPTVTKWVRKGGATIRSRGQRKKGSFTVGTPVEAVDPVETFEPRDEIVTSEPVARQIFQG